MTTTLPEDHSLSFLRTVFVRPSLPDLSIVFGRNRAGQNAAWIKQNREGGFPHVFHQVSDASGEDGQTYHVLSGAAGTDVRGMKPQVCTDYASLIQTVCKNVRCNGQNQDVAL